MRQPGKLVQDLQHRGNVEPHELTGGQGRQRVCLVVTADHREVRDVEQ